ncbi:sensor histidine kinase [Spirosoma fluviale]|uniref:Oxygen sensor histidine kinase NreB n=1 Tax=Spirosoma fluviale TaxID=1597977 RepID=A0A286GVZ2_9BACT|nr:7TM diverse intracellular signaling domain-containing protein [Spirosoma fluviale]SOD99690.1 Signal transduction histidine kinase [Spirosoma fluviale]
MRCFLLLIAFGFAYALPGRASIPVHLPRGQPFQLIGLQTDYLSDPTYRLLLADVQRSAVAHRFLPTNQEIPNLPSSKPSHWFRFVFQPDKSQQHSQYLVEVGFGNIRRIDMYVVRAGRPVYHVQAGDAIGKAGRPLSFHTFVLPLPESSAQPQTVYLHIENKDVHSYFPLAVWERNSFLDHAQRASLLWGIYWGILLLMFLYHAIIWLFTHDRGYMYLALYLLAYLFYESARGSNIGARYLWPDSHWFIENNLAIFSVAVIAAFTLFYSHALNLRYSAVVFWQFLRWLSALSAVLMLVKLANWLPISSQSLAILSSYPLVFVMFLAGLRTWRHGQQAARFYVIASMCYALGFTIFVLNRTNVLPGTGFFLHYSQNIGSLLEFLFMAIGLASYVSSQQQQRLNEERRRIDVERLALVEQLRQREELDAALIDGQIQERRRVADELHDHLGSVLFSVRARLSELDSANISPQVLESLLNTVRDAYDDVRLISHNLWPDELEKLGFGYTLQQLIASLNRIGKTQFALQLSGLEDELERHAKFHLYCICLELVNNILKHAQASEASIRFLPDPAGAGLRLSVRDDGVGFQQADGSGRGLRTVRERIERLEGTVSFSKLPEGEGTWIQIRVPVHRPQTMPTLTITPIEG